MVAVVAVVAVVAAAAVVVVVDGSQGLVFWHRLATKREAGLVSSGV